MQTPNNRSERTPPRYRQIKISVHRQEVRKTNLDSGLVVLEGRKVSLLRVRGSDTQ